MLTGLQRLIFITVFISNQKIQKENIYHTNTSILVTTKGGIIPLFLRTKEEEVKLKRQP